MNMTVNVILKSLTHEPHTTHYVDLGGYDPYSAFTDLIITTYCKIKITVPPDQNIDVTILEADNNDVMISLCRETLLQLTLPGQERSMQFSSYRTGWLKRHGDFWMPLFFKFLTFFCHTFTYIHKQ